MFWVLKTTISFIPSLSSIDFCHLQITFAISLDPDQDWLNVGPEQDPKLFDTLIVFLKEFVEKVNYEKNLTTKS